MKNHFRIIFLLSIPVVAIIVFVQAVNGVERIPPEKPWWVPVIASFLLNDPPLPETEGNLNDTGVIFGGDYHFRQQQHLYQQYFQPPGLFPGAGFNRR